MDTDILLKVKIPVSINIQQDTVIYSLFISANCSTYFGWYLHPSSGAHITVSAVSGNIETVTATCREIETVTANCRERHARDR